MHEKVQTRNCTGVHQSRRKISQRSKIEKKMYFDAWKLTYCTLYSMSIFTVYNHPDMWPFFNSASAKKLAQVVNYQVQQEKRWWWCWGDLGSSLLNGNEKPNQKWHFFCDLWWFLMISLRLSFFQWNFLTTLFLAIFPKKYFLKRRMLPQLLLHPRYFRE